MAVVIGGVIDLLMFLQRSTQSSGWFVWTHWRTRCAVSTTLRSGARGRCCCGPAVRWSSGSSPSWWSTDTSGSSRSSTITEPARSSSTWLEDWTSAVSSPPGSMSPSTRSRSGPTTCFRQDSLVTLSWPPLEESWIMRRPEESILEEKFLVSSSKSDGKQNMVEAYCYLMWYHCWWKTLNYPHQELLHKLQIDMKHYYLTVSDQSLASKLHHGSREHLVQSSKKVRTRIKMLPSLQQQARSHQVHLGEIVWRLFHSNLNVSGNIIWTCAVSASENILLILDSRS